MSGEASRAGRKGPGRLRRLLHRPREAQNRLIVISLAVVLLVLGVASGYWILLRAAYLLLTLLPLAWLWAQASTWKLELQVERQPDRLQMGQDVTTTVQVRNLSSLPKLALEIEDPTNMPGAQAKAVLSVPGRGLVSWQQAVPCKRRGLYTFGPVWVSGGDPFGLFRVRATFGERWKVLVYPAPEELPYLSLPPAYLASQGPRHRPTPQVTPNVAGVREHQPGDPLNRIHWLSTARLGRLMVKTFDVHPASDLWLVLDLEAAVHAGQGEDSTEEYAVRIACSLAHKLLMAGLRVGYLAQGQDLTVLTPSRGPKHYERLMEALAMLRADGHRPLEEVLQEQARIFGRQSILIVVTPSTREEWVSVLQTLHQYGVQAAVVLLDAGTFGAREAALIPYTALVAADILTYLVRRGDDLAVALGPGGASERYWVQQLGPRR